jgi:hypothetical protein
MAMLFLILMAVGAFFGYRLVSKLVDEYTSTTPRELPKVEMPAEERQAIKDRVESFRKAVEAGTPTEPLVLTSDDLNGLIDDNPDLKGKFYVKIAGDQVKGEVSLPLERIGLSLVKGRYLNGEADFKASLSDGVLFVTLDSIEVNGQKPPENIMEGIRKENLAKDAYKDEKNASLMRKLESLEIKDGKIILKVRAKPTEKSSSASGKGELPVEVVAPAKKEATNGEPTKTTEPPKGNESKTTPEPATAGSATPKT